MDSHLVSHGNISVAGGIDGIAPLTDPLEGSSRRSSSESGYRSCTRQQEGDYTTIPTPSAPLLSSSSSDSEITESVQKLLIVDKFKL